MSGSYPEALMDAKLAFPAKSGNGDRAYVDRSARNSRR